MSKIFFALSPPFEVRQQIIETRAASGLSGSFSKSENIHLTVLYLGQMTHLQQQQIITCANLIRLHKFDLLLNRIDCFKSNQIAWMGLHDTPPALLQLHQQLNNCAIALGLEIAKCRFKAHITLARHSKLQAPINCSSIKWPVCHFELLESKQRCDGVNYSLLKRFDLALS